jgi:hypothetical protein
MYMQLPAENVSDPLKIRVFGHWKQYKARIGATLLEGSYYRAKQSFQGKQFLPWIDIKSGCSGEAWTEIKNTVNPLPRNSVIAIRYQGNA